MDDSVKQIGLWSALSIGIGGMVGAGIFSILGVAAEIAGMYVYLAFIAAGVVALLCAYSYSKLGVRFPSAGGPVEFLVRGFGDSVWTGGLNILLWVGYIFALSLYASAFAHYFLAFFPDLPSFWFNIAASGIILFFTVINTIGAKAVGKSEIFIVSVKIGILLIFAFLGTYNAPPKLFSTSESADLVNILFAAGMVFIAFEGFGLITNTAENMKMVKKTLPRALYISVIFVTLLYVFVSFALISNLPLEQIKVAEEYALAEAARPFLGMMGF